MAISSSQLFDEVIGALHRARQVIIDLKNTDVRDGTQAYSSGADTQSFILKVWGEGLEEVSGETQHLPWRGHITHVPSGQRRYVQSFTGVQEFIALHIGK